MEANGSDGAVNALETEGLSKEYVGGWNKRIRLLALDALTLKVEQGQIFGFLGPNGAGKSTAIKLLLGLISPTAGSGRLFGVSIHDKQARERVGFLPEDPSFCTYLKADEFLELCGKVLHMDRAQRKQRIAETLEMVGLSNKAGTKIAEFSRGMLQRIGLAQALLNMPSLVLLDEPLNGLDPYGRKELKAILQAQKAQGKTVFFSSHILSDVQEMCDQVGILNRGRLVACGRLKELLPPKTVRLQAQTLDMASMSRLEPFSASITREHSHWTIQLLDASKKDEACGILRSQNNQAIEVVSAAESLEEYFFRKIEENNQERGFGAPTEPVSASTTQQASVP
ncbi:MAG: ABC transporter ATP-binding protein [Verrucomicrobia bacterium]|nr:ABC transporter ATP-binding protein [Verrucomicrobiota bacterium]